MAEENKAPKTPENVIIRRHEDFTSLYANNIIFESSVWDLKFLFGMLDQSRSPNEVEQHTSISVSWLQAKLMAYYLEVNLSVYEADHGTIRVPLNVTPPRPDPSAPEIPDNELARAVMEYLTYVHRRFFGELKPPVQQNEAEGTTGPKQQAEDS